MWWRLYICSCCHVNNDHCAVAAWGNRTFLSSISGFWVPGNLGISIDIFSKLNCTPWLIHWLYHCVIGTDVWWNGALVVSLHVRNGKLAILLHVHFPKWTQLAKMQGCNLSGSLSRTKHRCTHYPWATNDSIAICATILFTSERSSFWRWKCCLIWCLIHLDPVWIR